eukprot:3110692-Rhodomonas_salina.2
MAVRARYERPTHITQCAVSPSHSGCAPALSLRCLVLAHNKRGARREEEAKERERAARERREERERVGQEAREERERMVEEWHREWEAVARYYQPTHMLCHVRYSHTGA